MADRIEGVENMEAYARGTLQEILRETQGCPHARVIGLYGELGAGKTTFVQHFARVLGVTEAVTSPTFVILKRYPVSHEIVKNLIHVDAYRLKSSSELYTLGWSNLLKDPSNLIFVEWAERVDDLLPNDAVRISFTAPNEQCRDIEKRYAKQ